MRVFILILLFASSVFAMPVMTITSIMPFDYFASLFIYLTITLIVMFGVLSIFMV
jgi:hypothetical protein